jgi:hypothetical protein
MPSTGGGCYSTISFRVTTIDDKSDPSNSRRNGPF